MSTGPATGDPGHDPGDDPGGADEFVRHRDRLFGLAYRMTGSVADAEDTVQDAFLRWTGADRAAVANPEAWLVAVTTRLCIDRARSARHRRETYVGPWLPEPLATGPAPGGPRPAPTARRAVGAGEGDPAAAAELADSLTFAFLVLVDRLEPVDRAVFLLREVFGLPYDEIARSVDRSAAACRQIVSRARRRIDTGAAVHRRPDGETEHALVGAFLVATTTGDTDALLALLSPDVVLVSDGGADHHAARRPVVGAARVARFTINVAKRLGDGATIEAARFNGDPAVLTREPDGVVTTLTFEFGDDGLVHRLWMTRNPEKLAHLVAGGDRPVAPPSSGTVRGGQ